MTRFAALLTFGGALILVTPAPAVAQFMPGFQPRGMPGLPGLPGLPGMPGLPGLPGMPGLPSMGANPFNYIPQYTIGYSLNFNTSLGRFSYGSYQYGYAGLTNQYSPWSVYPSTPMYMQTGFYTSGGANVRPDLVQAAQRELMKAQHDASVPGAKSEIAGQWKYEVGGAGTSAPPADTNPVPAGPIAPGDPLRKLLAPPKPADIVSGDGLNELLREIQRLEAKGAKGPSAYIPPLLLDDMRFAGSPAADLLNLARRADDLEFPAAFNDAPLLPLRIDLAKDFAAAAVAVRAGKAPEAAKLTRLETTFQKVQDAAGPVVKDLPFEEATATRRFINRMASAIKGMKGNTPVGLIDPKWSAEGLTVADLVKHMTRHKLLFGAAPRGSEESYVTMYRNFATYLFTLAQPKK